MGRRINHRAYPREIQGVPVKREALDALHRKLAVIMADRRAAERPIIDLLAEAWMMGVIDAGRYGLDLTPKESGDGE